MSAKDKDTFDLGSIDPTADCNKPYEVQLVHPATEKPLGVFWSVLGNQSDLAKEYNREQIGRDQRKAAQARKRGKDPEIKTLEMLEEETIDWLTVCSTGWRSARGPVINFEGNMLEFNVANCRMILTKKPFIRTQLSEAILDLENFMKG